MRNLSGWVAGALGVSAVAGAFFLGGRLAETGRTAAPAAAPPAVTALPAAATSGAPEFAVECEPGQRAVVRTTAGTAPSVSCVNDPRPVADTARPAYALSRTSAPDVVRVADRTGRPFARPAVLSEPTEVYQPRSRRVSDDTREVAAPKRSVRKSVAIIAGSTAAGAVAGGLIRGGKGAVVGGLLGGGAATVWDQVTRRQHADR